MSLVGCAMLLGLFLGCATFDEGASNKLRPTTPEQIAALRAELLELPGLLVNAAIEQEAQRIADKAVVHAKLLAMQYRVHGSPRMHNTWVNVGVKERGLCYHFAHDLKAELVALHLQYYHIIDVAARHESQLRAHYAIAVGVPGSTFGKHILLDAWRDGGQLFWSRIEEDKRYPWRLWNGE